MLPCVEEPAAADPVGVPTDLGVVNVVCEEQAIPKQADKLPAEEQEDASASERPREGQAKESEAPMPREVSEPTPVEVPVPAEVVDETPMEISAEPEPAVAPETSTVESTEATTAETGPTEVLTDAVKATVVDSDAATAVTVDAADVTGPVEHVGDRADPTKENVSEVLASAAEEDEGAPASEPPAPVEAVVVCDIPVDAKHDVVPKAAREIAEATDVVAPEVPLVEAKTPLPTRVSDPAPVPVEDVEATSVEPVEVPVTVAAVNKTLIDDSTEPGLVVPKAATVEFSEATPGDAGKVKVSEGDDDDTVTPVASAGVDVTGVSGPVKDIREEVSVVQDDKAAPARVSEVPAFASEGAVGTSEQEMPVPSEAMVCDIPMDVEHDDVHAAREVAAAIQKVVMRIPRKVDICRAGEFMPTTFGHPISQTPVAITA